MSEQNGYEIDLLPVGEGEKSGDAITVRWGNAATGYKVMVVDGGTKDAGKKLVEHIKTNYGTTVVDYMVCTHPDNDHSSGLRMVMDELTVKELWIHDPSKYNHHVFDFIKDGRVTPNSIMTTMQKSLSTAHELADMAKEKGIPVREPLQGSKIGMFTVLSPSLDFYKTLLAEEYGDGDATERVVDSLWDTITKALDSVAETVVNAVADLIPESWDIETLREGGKTRPMNETSVVMYANFDGRGVLLTGDAGLRALSGAADYADILSIPLNQARFIQIPHHGSRKNVSPSLLNRIVGDPLQKDAVRTHTLSAFVSASSGSSTHPRKVVTNAFRRRGAKVYGTLGKQVQHHHNMPARETWTSAKEIPFHDQVESYEKKADKTAAAA